MSDTTTDAYTVCNRLFTLDEILKGYKALATGDKRPSEGFQANLAYNALRAVIMHQDHAAKTSLTVDVAGIFAICELSRSLFRDNHSMDVFLDEFGNGLASSFSRALRDPNCPKQQVEDALKELMEHSHVILVCWAFGPRLRWAVRYHCDALMLGVTVQQEDELVSILRRSARNVNGRDTK